MSTKYRTVVYKGRSPIRYTVEVSTLDEGVSDFVKQIEHVIISLPWHVMRVELERSDGFSCKTIQTFNLS